MDLTTIKDLPGARHSRKRVGRGAASGTGKTAGRGVKGQKSRSGVSIKGFEGGQMPMYRRVPKRGFTNIFRTEYAEVTLGRLQAAVDAKKLDAKKAIDTEALIAAGLVRPNKLGAGIKILASGSLSAKLSIEVAKATSAAVTAIEAAGGKVTTLVASK